MYYNEGTEPPTPSPTVATVHTGSTIAAAAALSIPDNKCSARLACGKGVRRPNRFSTQKPQVPIAPQDRKDVEVGYKIEARTVSLKEGGP